MIILQKAVPRIVAVAFSTALLAACGGSNNNTSNPVEQGPARFEVRITNLSNAQPLSPVAVVMHQNGFNSFIDGETSSAALELLAEGGDNSDLLSEAQGASEHIDSGSTAGPIGPRAISDAVTLEVPSDQLDNIRLTVISMLVHTNDAFTGSNATNISGMAVGDRRVMTGPTWDAGTESNSELASTMPGPDFGGEGFNAIRDDIIDRVRFHQGVVTSASVESGLATSALVERHRFDNPTSRIIVERIE